MSGVMPDASSIDPAEDFHADHLVPARLGGIMGYARRFEFFSALTKLGFVVSATVLGACGGGNSGGSQDGASEGSLDDAKSQDAAEPRDSPGSDATRGGSGVECHYADTMRLGTCVSHYYANVDDCQGASDTGGPGPCPVANYDDVQGRLVGCCVVPSAAPGGAANPLGPNGVCFYSGACAGTASCIEDSGVNSLEAICEDGGAYGNILVKGMWSTTPP